MLIPIAAQRSMSFHGFETIDEEDDDDRSQPDDSAGNRRNPSEVSEIMWRRGGEGPALVVVATGDEEGRVEAAGGGMVGGRGVAPLAPLASLGLRLAYFFLRLLLDLRHRSDSLRTPPPGSR